MFIGNSASTFLPWKSETEIIEAIEKALLDIGQSFGPLIKPMHTETTSTQLNKPKTNSKLKESLPGKLCRMC